MFHLKVEEYRRNTCPTSLLVKELRGTHFLFILSFLLLYSVACHAKLFTESKERSVEMAGIEPASGKTRL